MYIYTYVINAKELIDRFQVLKAAYFQYILLYLSFHLLHFCIVRTFFFWFLCSLFFFSISIISVVCVYEHYINVAHLRVFLPLVFWFFFFLYFSKSRWYKVIRLKLVSSPPSVECDVNRRVCSDLDIASSSKQRRPLLSARPENCMVCGVDILWTRRVELCIQVRVREKKRIYVIHASVFPNDFCVLWLAVVYMHMTR